MKRTFLWMLVLLLCAPVMGQNTRRIMSFNIRNGRGMDGKTDVQRTAEAILRAAPDVVAVQEVDSMTCRSNNTYVLGELALRTNMHAYFAPAINLDGGKYGIGILSREEPLHIERMPLPGREEKRTLILVEFSDYIFCCTHLSLTAADRIKSLKTLRELCTRTHKPLFLAGDLNSKPKHKFIKELKKDFVILSSEKEFTFPADKPTRTIDYITVAKTGNHGFTVTRAEVLNEPVASDHRPVLVELRTEE